MALQEAFNASYLKPNPDTIVHVPPPTAYTKEGALAELRSSGEAQDAKEEISPIEKATRIRDIQEEGSENAIYWNKILLTLTQINDVKARRPLSSDEQEVESVILQRLTSLQLASLRHQSFQSLEMQTLVLLRRLLLLLGLFPRLFKLGHKCHSLLILRLL